jgi:hypothetical protein
MGRMLDRLTGGSNAGEEEAEDALAAAVAGTGADSVTCGSLRVLVSSGGKLLRQQMHWSRRYFLLTSAGLQWWYDRESAEDQQADGKISDIVDVTLITRRTSHHLKLGCPDHDVMFVLECGISTGSKTRNKKPTPKPSLTYFAANSPQKRDIWVAALRRVVASS